MTAETLSVIHISTETGWRGGEQQVKLVSDGLVRRGQRCTVVCPPNSALYQDRQRAGIAHPLRYMSEFDLLAARRLAALAKETKAHLFHAQTSHAHSLAWLASRWARIPVVVARRVDFPVGGNFFSRRKYHAPSTYYIAISHAVKQVLVEGGIDSSRISVVHSGVDPARFEPRSAKDAEAAAAYGARPGEHLIVNVAALTDHKDQSTLLHAAALLRQELPNFRLVIAGAGELEVPLKQLCTQLELDSHVHFAGHVHDLATLYRAADLFVLSSHLEGLCTSILDAMLAGVPVVATRTGGVPEIVEHEVTGLLATPRQPQELAQAIARALGDSALREQFVQAGRKKVLSEFTADSMVEGTLEAYRRILTAD